jgi:hypothetical protein
MHQWLGISVSMQPNVRAIHAELKDLSVIPDAMRRKPMMTCAKRADLPFEVLRSVFEWPLAHTSTADEQCTVG